MGLRGGHHRSATLVEVGGACAQVVDSKLSTVVRLSYNGGPDEADGARMVPSYVTRPSRDDCTVRLKEARQG